MDYKDMDIGPDLLERAKACTSPEELLALAKQEGIEISDGELEGFSGGWDCSIYGEDLGDVREDVDPDKAHADFVNSIVDGGELQTLQRRSCSGP